VATDLGKDYSSKKPNSVTAFRLNFDFVSFLFLAPFTFVAFFHRYGKP
jgi:hypothetical protein